MPEFDPSEHPNGQTGAASAGGLAIADPGSASSARASARAAATGSASPPAQGARSELTPPGARPRERSGGLAGPRGRELNVVLQYLDVLVVVVGTPVALALGAPVFGLLVGAIAWIVQRVLARTDKRWVARAAQPRAKLGLSVFEAFARIWLLAGAIIVAGAVGGRADGLTAAIVICVAYSVAFAIRVLAGKPTPEANRGVVR
ncbi:MAG TPA: hypothetical protein VEJ23_07610 [Solirubrobacteraceae bacterium]|nr:hypothetical protein [Solirubrobacteraceae bacterium]